MRKEESDNNYGNQDLLKTRLPNRVFMLLLYNLSLGLYVGAIKVYSLFNDKAGKWLAGRKNWEPAFAARLQPGEKRIWVHCASVGEFEQAKPVIEAIKKQYPQFKIVLTFFSPSGYEACKASPLADYVFYLPMDGKHNAGAFVSLVAPVLAVFVKYEFWYHYLACLLVQGVPAILVSGAFRPQQPFFKAYGGLFRDMLACFHYFFLQDDESALALKTIGITQNVIVSGDTRYDRVAAIAVGITPVSAIEIFKGNSPVLIAGSSWPADEAVLKECMEVLPPNWKLIIAPHEVDNAHIRKIEQLFEGDTLLFSELIAANTGTDKRVLVINNIGMLSRLFAYGDIAFIGGGFYKGGIHNILEPAVFGLPVIFGPVFEKFVEAKKMASLKIVFPINNAGEAKLILKKLIQEETYRADISNALKLYMHNHIGATDLIIKKITSEGWLK
jgi:3-deoxy-D-manno-octulosonic-acid transferase